MSLIIPENYKSNLNGRETEKAIKFIKDTFQHEIISALNLQRISAPLFVRPETGLNDNLNGVERPVSFDAPCIGGATLEIVHSLAKWKRMTLGRYGFNPGEGLYTDMNAIRRDEEVDNLHSMYVDQWDWEAVINKSDRTVETLKSFVERIYTAMKSTQSRVCQKFSGIENNFPEEITFITTQELEDMYPDLEPKERENKLLRHRIGSLPQASRNRWGRSHSKLTAALRPTRRTARAHACGSPPSTARRRWRCRAPRRAPWPSRSARRCRTPPGASRERRCRPRRATRPARGGTPSPRPSATSPQCLDKRVVLVVVAHAVR